MATYQTYQQIGLAEDVSDVISNISPTKTPFQTSIGSEKVSAKLFEWQEDSLRAVQVNAAVEGFTASDATLTPTVMRSNVTQILEKTIKVSATSDVVKTYGRAKETAYQIAKAGEEVKRDLEHAMVGLDQAAVTGDAVTARQFASVFAQLDATKVNDNSGTPRALSEALILAGHQELFDAGSEPSILMIKPADSLITAGFAAVADSRARDIRDSKKIVNAVDIYVSPFGELRIVINRFISATRALMYDPDMWKKCVLRPWTRTMLAKTGDNEMHMLVGEYSLKHKNYNASLEIGDLS